MEAHARARWEEELRKSQDGLRAWAAALGLPVTRLQKEYARELMVVQLLHGRDADKEADMFFALTKKWGREAEERGDDE